MKVAVVGTESSGTRLMTRIMEDAGAEALHRSFPYGASSDGTRRWPEPDINNFNPDAIIWMTRDWWATAPSQVKAGHVPSLEKAWDNIPEATERIASICRYNNYYMVNYESLIQRPQIVVRNLVNALNLTMPDLEDIVDGNTKYLGN